MDLVWKDITVLSDLGSVTYPAYPTNLYFVGDTITIDLPELGVDEVDMIITGRDIEVTPDYWKTTYTLWKGFTS
jgi:hypothetical protein